MKARINNLITKLEPDLIVGGTILDLTPDILHRYNLKGLVLDVDGTLVPMNVSDASKELLQWVEEIRKIACLWLVSNNISAARIGGIANALDLPYIVGAAKPSRRKLRQAVVDMNLDTHEVAMVGDRLFTDVLAGNRLGMFTILVEPMVDPVLGPSSYDLIRDVEVSLSKALGVSIPAKQQNLSKHHHKSSQK